MALIAVEGVVENGQIRLEGSVVLPERTKVYVVIPDAQERATKHIRTPHLADPSKAKDFVKRVIDGAGNAGV